MLLAWVPWGQGDHWLLQPLFSFQVILLAFAAYRDMCAAVVPPIQQVPQPLKEWLVWALVPAIFLFSAFLTASLIGTLSPLLVVTLFGISLIHAFLAEHDYRRVLSNLSHAEEQVRHTNSALATAIGDLEAVNRRLEGANYDLAAAHAAAQAAAATSEAFIARIVHDLAPPVQGLTSVIRDVSCRTNPPPGYDVAVRQLRLLETFVQQARTYLQARTVGLHRTLLPLLPLCQAAIGTIAMGTQQRGIVVLQDIEAEVPTVWGDEAAILRILDNFLRNALGVTPDGGQIIVRVTVPSPGWVEIAIIDQGPGISVDKQATLFQPYASIQLTSLDQRSGFAPSPTGTGMGLGLAIVKELTVALGGTCGVLSSPDTGSTFYVRLATEELHNATAESRPTSHSRDRRQ